MKNDTYEHEIRPGFRDIPAVGTLVNHEGLAADARHYGAELVSFAAREVITCIRETVAAGHSVPSTDTCIQQVKNLVIRLTTSSLKRVINATGVVLHTNLGRAPLGRETADHISATLTGYTNLEFNLNTGRRGHREDHLRLILRYLTGAEDVVIVNNNAAAIMLILAAFAKRKEVLVSRGELIEIGGSFRLPAIMAASGAKMVEVGTTNKTRLSDYKTALTAKTSLIVKVHPSNFRVRGFTEEVPLHTLAAWTQADGHRLVYDIGSGLLRRPEGLPLGDEPDVRQALKEGADCVCFSCDKLLGGPQAGIVAGKQDLIRALAKHPMMRAFRVGKLTIAALEHACRGYLSFGHNEEISPVFSLLERTEETCAALAQSLVSHLRERDISSDSIPTQAQCGGGTLPIVTLPSRAVVLRGITKKRAGILYRELMSRETPVIGFLREGCLWFDMRTVTDEEMPLLVEAITDSYQQIVSRPQTGGTV